jgi:hypothetical protein
MIRNLRFSAFALAMLAGSALGDATSYKPHATGFTLPNAQKAVSATSAQTADYATTAGSTGYATRAGTATTATSATNAGYATSAGSAKTATSATSADSATYATNAGVASQAAGLTAGHNCPAGTALSVTDGVLGCVSSVTSISGTLDGSQITGNITNVSVVRASGNIVAGGNLVSTGYVNGNGGLYSGSGVYADNYYGRGGGSNATFNGNASTSSSAVAVTGTVNGSQIVGNLNVGTINASGNIISQGYTYGVGGLFSDSGVYSNSYASRWGGLANFNGNASTANYASSSNVGILYQNAPPNGGGQPTYSCASGYHIASYDTNVDSTNNAFFFGCVQNGY